MPQVLALKYRPSNFDKLIGQNAIITTLSSALSQNRLSHAYLFSGLRGSGKTSTARIFAKALVCDQGPTKNPCEVCENCKMANENRHIDIIEMDAASSRKIDDIRDLIEHTKYKPSIARFKIFIIDEVHMLTKEAFNALLKTLEEPPEFVKFILATTDPMKLPATILSRTQHFRFRQISRNDTVKHLEHILNLEGIKYDVGALEMIARAGSGSLRDTLTLLDQAIIFSKSDLTPSLVASMLGLLDPVRLDEIFAVILNEDKKRMLEIIKELGSYECDTVIDEMISYLKERYFEQDARFSTMLCERFFRILSEAKSLLFLNAENGFVLTLVFFKMIEALNIKKVDDMIASLENVKFEPLIVKKSETITIDKPAANQKTHNDKFEELIAKITDRNAELGECFEQSVKFVEFKDDTLYLSSNAQGKCQKLLRQSSVVIKHFVRDIFGFETKFSIIQTENEQEQQIPQTSPAKEQSEQKKEYDEPHQIQKTDMEQTYEQQETVHEQPNMEEHPFIKKATNLFAADDT
ncbi:MAG: DNA polymerase III subunit gamma/tau [Campylobacteraceae bacterium]|nr:DNA polymerase III subunit gamma/tau [Campylobacteraceae bacterium]